MAEVYGTLAFRPSSLASLVPVTRAEMRSLGYESAECFRKRKLLVVQKHWAYIRVEMFDIPIQQISLPEDSTGYVLH
jgi:hypothetical protein